MEEVDVLIVGAGLSGIGAAHHLQRRLPGKSYVILEGREASGGTWDLFRYPGIRSDSDMFTLGYAFRPWTEAKAIADGPSILSYIRRTAAEAGIDRHIRFGHRVVAADWDSGAARWRVTARVGGEERRFVARFLFTCTGYYNYEAGYTPDFPGRDDFTGDIVHPQHWPADLDHAGRQVVVIGSGATAVTLVPAMAETAAKVTMLQRSPTWIVALPAEDGAANALGRVLPRSWVYRLIRWKNVLRQQFIFGRARRRPAWVADRILRMARDELGPDYDIATHLTPRYDPWTQRMCLTPDGDLFAAIRAGRAEIVTDGIERFETDGVRLASGRLLPADIIVTATGLDMQLLHRLALSVDGVPVRLGEQHLYRGMMLSDVPNLILFFGYTNASWTLKADLTADYACRLIRDLDRRGADAATPVRTAEADGSEPFIDFSSGYIRRATDQLPKQGSRAPWRLHQNYARDLASLRFGRIDDGVLRFSRAGDRTAA